MLKQRQISPVWFVTYILLFGLFFRLLSTFQQQQHPLLFKKIISQLDFHN